MPPKSYMNSSAQDDNKPAGEDEHGFGVLDWHDDPVIREFGFRVPGSNIVRSQIPTKQLNTHQLTTTSNHGHHLATYNGYAAESKGNLRKMRMAMYSFVADLDFDQGDLVGQLSGLSRELCNRKQQKRTSEELEMQLPTLGVSKLEIKGYPNNVITLSLIHI